MASRLVRDVVKDHKLAALPPGASVREAAHLMAQRKIGSVVVLEGDRLVGIFTERDIVNRIVDPGRDPDRTVLKDVMTRDPRTVDPDTAALEALRLMGDGHYRHLPVMQDGRLVGVVSRRDFFGEEKAAVEQQAQARDALWERV